MKNLVIFLLVAVVLTLGVITARAILDRDPADVESSVQVQPDVNRCVLLFEGREGFKYCLTLEDAEKAIESVVQCPDDVQTCAGIHRPLPIDPPIERMIGMCQNALSIAHDCMMIPDAPVCVDLRQSILLAREQQSQGVDINEVGGQAQGGGDQTIGSTP